MKCVFFDLDGTIADTEILKAQALSLAVQHFHGNSRPEIYKNVMGKSWEIVTSYFFQESQINIELEIFNPVFRKFYIQLIEEQLKDTRSITAYINILKNNEYKIALVTSASPWMVEHVLQKLNLQNKFDLIITNADTVNHKPDPEGYFLAIKKLNANLDFSFAFEDSESGFQAANKAGLKTYGVKHEYNGNHNFDMCLKTIGSFNECLNWKL